MEMNQNGFLKVGSNHLICEDHIIFGDDPCPYVILSDGCSSSKVTNAGSLILTHLAHKYIDFRKGDLDVITHQDIGQCVLYEARSMATLLNLETTCLDATLMIAFHHENMLHVFVYGDGFIIGVTPGDSIIVREINYKKNAPFYLSYSLDAGRFQEYADEEGNDLIITNFNMDYAEMAESNKYPSITPVFFEFGLYEYDELYIASDGISSFVKEGKLLPVGDVIQRILKLDNPKRKKKTKGKFLQRWCRGAIRRLEKDGYKHTDDISFGGLVLKEEKKDA